MNRENQAFLQPHFHGAAIYLAAKITNYFALGIKSGILKADHLYLTRLTALFTGPDVLRIYIAYDVIT